MKAGKALEQLVAAIQEYLGDNPDTHIERNAKLIDNAGLQREIDVFVQTKVQGGKIGIAFECKDYKNAVQVSVVEAFHSKCNDIPQIHNATRWHCGNSMETPTRQTSHTKPNRQHTDASA